MNDSNYRSPVHAWFLNMFFVDICMCVHVCMCACPRLLITSGVMWCDVDPYDWLKKFYRSYMAAVVGIASMHGLKIDGHRRNQPNKSKLALYKPLLLL